MILRPAGTEVIQANDGTFGKGYLYRGVKCPRKHDRRHRICIPGLQLFRDFATQFPSARIDGIDLSPVQPDMVPTNCEFAVDDMNAPSTFPDGLFDFVHLRGLTGCVPDWSTTETKL